jgi:hypothetical protein
MGAKFMMTILCRKNLAWAFLHCQSGALPGLGRQVFYPI